MNGVEYYRAFTHQDNESSSNKFFYMPQGYPVEDFAIKINSNLGGNAPSSVRDEQLVNILNDGGGNTNPTLDTNNTLRVAQNQSNVIIDAEYLEVTDEEQTATEIIFTLTETPAYGYLYKNGGILGVSDTFTQDDIDTNLVTYSHSSAAPSPTDLFKFTVSDGDGGSISETTFNIDIELTSIMMKVISRLLKFKV